MESGEGTWNKGNYSEAKLWKVFLPHQLLSSPKGHLQGVVHKCIKSVYLHSVMYHQHEIPVEDKKENDSDLNNMNCVKSEIVGTWIPSSEDTGRNKLFSKKKPVWVAIQTSSSSPLICQLYITKNNQRVPQKCLCILYDPREVLSSHILGNGALSVSTQEKSQQISTSSRCGHPSFANTETISNVIRCMSELKHREPKCNKRNDSVCCWVDQQKSDGSVFGPFMNLFLQSFMAVLLAVGKLFVNRWTDSGVIQFFINGPTVIRQLRQQHSQVKLAAGEKSDISIEKLRYLDVCVRQVIDTALGVGLMIVMMRASAAEDTAASIMSWADGVGSSLTRLVHWLMGAPAGLKLNAQLTNFLGHFFLYHIYLWTGYLSILRPLLGSVLWYSSVFGILGISVQLCLIQDIISMLTIHIYCFYVYAARLHSLQVYGLASLWHLFRGKKWNVLRHRVDSAHYDTDQLFVGTLFFTIFLFLLPTTILYYTVFLMLRLVVVVVQGFLAWCVRLVNHIPAYTLTLWLFRSKSVAGDVMFTVVPDSYTEDCLLLSMQTTHLPLSKLLAVTQISSTSSPKHQSYSFGALLGRMIKGRLIYPWIEETPLKEKTS